MELRKESVQMLRVKSRATSQVTFDTDYNVPDAKPDIGRMIQNKGDISLDEVRLSDGRAFIKGNLNADLLYVGEQEGKVYSLSAKLPFNETLNLEGIVSGDKMCLKWEIEDLSIHIIHSRKLSIKAIVTFYAVVDEMAGIQLPVAISEENISVKKKRVRLMSLMVHKKDTLRVKDEITLASNKPNISELLWHTIEVRGLDLRPEENMIKARGELFVFVLYVGDDEGNPLQWLEYSLPFNGEVECTGCTEEMIPNIEVSIMHQGIEVKPDSDGEERTLVADVVLELDMKLYREEEHDLILDVYTPLKECIPQGQPEMLESLLVRNFSKCRVTDRVEVKETQGKILQICHSQGRVKVDRTQIVENGIQVDGIVHMKVLYIIGNDDMPFYSMEAMVPFTHVVEARGITPDSTFFLQTDLEQLSTTMADSDELEVKATVSVNALVLKCETEKIISKVDEMPLDLKKIQAMPGITVYMVKPKDTMWDIAKRFYTTVEEVCALNDLTDEKIEPGQPLLLVKKVES
ncbi:MAG: DUF3794 domain-containing protein [Blautia sp.]|nr:DUF3794 domain-containing protein [Blautia sp.]MDD7729569.1 DUF3794 domain-containing protein [Clostridia bacterium]MDY5664841.1 DUF3794 domain-containing protein [Blautia sp.]